MLAIIISKETRETVRPPNLNSIRSTCYSGFCARLSSILLPSTGRQPTGGEEEEGKGKEKRDEHRTDPPSVRGGVPDCSHCSLPTSLPAEQFLCAALRSFFPRAAALAFGEWVGRWEEGNGFPKKKKRSRFPISPFPFSTSVRVLEKKGFDPY